MIQGTKQIAVDPVVYDRTRKLKKWVVRHRDGHGKRRRRSFAFRPEAVAFRKQLLASARFGPEAAPVSLSHAMDRFLGSLASRNRYKLYESVLRLHVAPRFGERWLHDIGADFAEEFDGHVGALPVGPLRRGDVRKALDGALEFARDRGWMPPAVAGLPKPIPTTTPALVGRARRDRRKVMPTLVDVDRLLSGADALPEDAGWLRVPIYLALRAGLRIGEILALRWGDVKFGKRVIHVVSSEPLPDPGREQDTSKRATPKTRSGHRLVPMSTGLVEVLRWWRRQVVADRDSKVVFRPTWGDAVPLTRAVLSREFILFQVRIGMAEEVRVHRPGNVSHTNLYPGHYSFHQLRHAYVAILIWSKIPKEQISAAVGHKTTRITIDMYGYLIRMHREGAATWPGGQDAAPVQRAPTPAQRIVERHGRRYRVHLPNASAPGAQTVGGAAG